MGYFGFISFDLQVNVVGISTVLAVFIWDVDIVVHFYPLDHPFPLSLLEFVRVLGVPFCQYGSYLDLVGFDYILEDVVCLWLSSSLSWAL